MNNTIFLGKTLLERFCTFFSRYDKYTYFFPLFINSKSQDYNFLFFLCLSENHLFLQMTVQPTSQVHQNIRPRKNRTIVVHRMVGQRKLRQWSIVQVKQQGATKSRLRLTEKKESRNCYLNKISYFQR